MRPPAAVTAAAALLTACAGAPRAVDGAAAPERLYRSKCAGCHRAYPPESHTRAQWAEVMPKMAEKAHLRDDERRTLLEWVEANAKDAPGAGR